MVHLCHTMAGIRRSPHEWRVGPFAGGGRGRLGWGCGVGEEGSRTLGDHGGSPLRWRARVEHAAERNGRHGILMPFWSADDLSGPQVPQVDAVVGRTHRRPVTLWVNGRADLAL
jgi:hypothetical protein